MPEWNQTKLWKLIRSKDNNTNLDHTVSVWMNKITTVLSHGSTSPRDFTLHDANHSFRVAERIYDFIPSAEINRLSSYELCLLLLSAYLHDIGMTPTQKTIESHYGYIVTGDKKLLSSTEIKEIHEWLDKDRPEIILPISFNNEGLHGIKLAEEILSYYTRHKHNDWSESWITENLTDVNYTLYSGCVNDIISICRSHHEGIVDLRQNRFDAKIVDNPPQTINLRWLSALLRIADVVEFDPERTPPVILEHRDISPKSRIFWYKDHSISFHIDKDQNQVIFSARTPSSKIHSAVINTSMWVDDELNLCITLHQEGAFTRGVMPAQDRDRYSWPWPARITRDIIEEGEKFTYIEGAFRPDIPKILELLSGTALYDSPFASIREIVQNSVDAIQEQIAYQRLQEDEPLDQELIIRLQNSHKVRITISKIDNDIWISCSDTGVGMDRTTIEKYLLVSGSPSRPGSRSLERLAQSKGFTVGRTGQFGIGVLSYFMMGDQLDIITRRSPEAGDHDHTAWHFSTDGITSFGELRKLSRSARGTEVKLKIRHDFIKKGLDVFIEDLLDYITKTMRKLPCKLELRNEVNSKLIFQSGPSWIDKEDNLKSGLFDSLGYRSFNRSLMTKDEMNINSKRTTLWKSFSIQATNLFKLAGPFEIDLMNESGSARFWIPYTEIDGDISLSYLFGDDEKIIAKENALDIYHPSSKLIVSWKGFSVSKMRNSVLGSQLYLNMGIFEVNLEKNATISASRSDLVTGIDGTVFLDMVGNFNKLQKQFLDNSSKSKFTAMNYAVTSLPLTEEIHKNLIENYYWISYSNTGKQLTFDKIRFPALEFHSANYEPRLPIASIRHNGVAIHVMQAMRARGNDLVYPSKIIPGGRLCLVKIGSNNSIWFGIQWMGLCDAFPSTGKVSHGVEDTMFSCCVFPPKWDRIAAIKTEYKLILNSGHDLFRAEFEISNPEFGSDATDEDKLRLSSSSKLLATKFFINSLNEKSNYWTALRDNFPDLYQQWWNTININDNIYYLIFTSKWDDNDCIEVSSNGGVIFEGSLNENSIKFEDQTLATIKWGENYAIKVNSNRENL